MRPLRRIGPKEASRAGGVAGRMAVVGNENTAGLEIQILEEI